jgi:hypothetical protein
MKSSIAIFAKSSRDIADVVEAGRPILGEVSTTNTKYMMTNKKVVYWNISEGF